MENKVKIEVSTASVLKVAAVIFGIWLLYLVRDIVVLFFFVLVIVAAVGPVVDRMSKYIPRILALIIITLIFFAILVAIGYLIIPPIINQLDQLALNLPELVQRFGPVFSMLKVSISSYQEGLLSLSSHFESFSSGLYTTTIGFLSGLVAFFTILVLSFYMLLEQEPIKNFLRQVIPLDQKETLFDVIKKISTKMGAWLRGHLLLMTTIGVLDAIVLFILGVPYALTLAVWGGLVEAIPYIGPWLGLIPAAIIAFTISPVKGLFVLITFIIIQQIESNFLAPKILGKAVGLSPVIVILALLVGAKLMGILGVIIAVPVAAALSVIVQEWPEIRKLKTKKP